MREIILLNITGRDHPGLTAALADVLADHGINILDIGQAVIHDHLSLGMLLEVPPEAQSGPVIKELLFQAHQLGLNIDFTPIDEEQYEEWVGLQGKPRYIVTLLGRKLTARNIAQVARVASRHGLNIDGITRLSGRFSLRRDDPHRRACVEFSVRGEPAREGALRQELLEISGTEEVDVAFQADDLYRRNRRLIVFDMDSTLIQVEVIDELARAAGVGDRVAAITEAAMRGEIDFKESFRRRMALLKGLDAGVLERIAADLPITEGAERLISSLKRLGYRIGILSGGFTYFARHLQQRLGVDCISANELEIENGVLTGRVSGEIVDGARKAELLQQMAREMGIGLQQVIAVGDGANDLPMLGLAGLGVAFHAKPVVRDNARHAISTLGLDGILYLLGVRDRELVE
ncbi:MAG TPA: phosphoserine phosphatase SerB [Sedimenticola thiotaurini]|uniref:Phosphoserine phosphatase n=1 Tax=Sedimenticola thiotaurini TaxID=1543721 RepID=A0A831RMA7_9GAMM|nr:phosphoserine phosphatase SerB [Sedimenticola thiotaurini]